MKKRLAALTILLMTCLTLSGCYPTEKRINSEISDSSSGNKHIDSSHFEYSKDNLSAGFDFPNIPERLPSRIKLKKKIFDRKKMIELFLGGEANISERVYEDEEYGYYKTEDGSELIVNGNFIKYYNGKISSEKIGDDAKFPVSYFAVLNDCKEYRRDVYSITENELDEFPLQTALKTANDLISELGITGCGDPEIYAVSLASYEKFYADDAGMFNENCPLTKDNEIYVFRFPQIIDGVKLSDMLDVVRNNTTGSEYMAAPSSVVVGISKEGIFEFYIEAAYETDAEILSTEHIKYDFNHAVIELEKHFDKVYFQRSRSVTLNKAEVIYYPAEINESDTMEFILTWSFNGYFRDLEMESAYGGVYPYDFRYLINTDIGVVREYSEV